jgi:hypothetical protein
LNWNVGFICRRKRRVAFCAALRAIVWVLRGKEAGRAGDGCLAGVSDASESSAAPLMLRYAGTQLTPNIHVDTPKQPHTHTHTMLVSLTVGKVDAGVAVLLTEDKRLVCPPMPRSCSIWRGAYWPLSAG